MKLGMKLLFSLLILILCCNVSVALTANLTNRTQYKDLNYWERWLCEQDDFAESDILGWAEDFILAPAYAMVTTPLTYTTGKPISGRADYCIAAIDTLSTMRNINKLTEPYEKYSGKNATQIGLEEYFFEEEKQLILVNTNTMWDYVKLIFIMVIEIILIMFYMLQLYLFIYILFIVIPKVFLKIRDSITLFLVKKYRKNRRRR